MKEHCCILAAAAALAFSQSLHAVDVIAGPVTNTANSHVYYLLAQSTWPEAEAEALRLGGHLVTINNQEEQNWVVQTFHGFDGNTNRDLWIGLNDEETEGTFVWCSGEPLGYSNWRAGEPNNSGGAENCVEIVLVHEVTLGQWNDLPGENAVREEGDRTITRHGVVEVRPHYQWIKWPAAEGGNDQYYALTAVAYTNWFNAEAEARLFGGHLVSINGSTEQNFIASAFLAGNTVSNVLWIGLNDIVSDGVFVWSSGEPLTYSNWNEGEPSGLGLQGAALMNLHYARGDGPRGSWSEVQASQSGRWCRGIIEAPRVTTLFTKIMSGAVVSGSPDLTRSGAAWGDFDNDGDPDLYVSVYGGTNLLYRNDSGGMFTQISTSPISTEYATTPGGVWGDYDNDGWLDLFTANLDEGQVNVLYRGAGNGDFSKVDATPFAQDKARSVTAAWADYDNDGFLDLFVANSRSNQVNFLYRNRGDGTFGKVTTGSVVNEVVNSPCASWSDYDSDGDLDLFVTSEAVGPNRLYRNNGDGTFTKITSGPQVTEGVASTGCAWADYDNDGLLDLFVANAYALDDFLYRNLGNGNFSKVTSSPVVSDSAWSVGCAWGDYDNDGFIDLFVCRQGAANALYQNNGDGSFSTAAVGSLVEEVGDFRGCAWADYDDDGSLDLVITGQAGEQTVLYRNVPTGNHWLKVRLVGTLSNRSGIGAKVRAEAVIAGQVQCQLREISGGSGFGSQNALDAHFGMGDATVATMLRIEWPSGMVQTLAAIPVDQTVTVHEPPKLEIGGPQANQAFEMILTSRGGFNYAIEACEDFVNWSLVGTLTNVTGSVQCLDSSAGQHPHRFYRAVMVP